MHRSLLIYKFAMMIVIVLATVQGERLCRASAQNANQTLDAQRSRDRAAQPPKSQSKFGLNAPKPRTKHAIRLATYNTLNLFDHVDDPTLQGEHDDIQSATDPKRCEKLAEAIRSLDPDIIALQEVESLQALTWFRDTWLKDCGYKYLASHDVGYYRGVECSILSRYEITESKVWLNQSLDRVNRIGPGWAQVPDKTPLTFQRSPLMVNIRVSPGYELTVFVVHHKAGREFDYHREAESLAINELISSLRAGDPSRNIVVMGDFNASPLDKSYRVYLENGMIDTMSYRVWQGDDAETALFKTHESNRVLDYILLNSAAHREFVIGSAFVLGTLTPPPTYDFRKDPFPPGYASDHYPVAIELTPTDVR